MRTYTLAINAWLTAAALCGAVDIGDTKESVISSLGEPEGFYASGETEILLYDAGEVKLQEGKVVGMTFGPTPAAFSSSRSEVSQSDLKLYFSFDGAGGAIRDDSGAESVATSYGAVHTVEGKHHGAYEFNGQDAFMQVAPDIALAPPYTVTAWVYLRSMLDDGRQYANYCGRTILARGNLNNSGAWDYIFNVNAYGKLGFVTHSAFSRADALQNPEVFPLNQWVFVAFTHDEKMTGRLYQDGHLVRVKANMGSGNSHRRPGSFIGKIYNTHPVAQGDHFWDGMIDDLRVYSTALSEQELQELQAVAPPLAQQQALSDVVAEEDTSESAPVFYLSFDDGTCKDTSGSGHDGTGHDVQSVSDGIRRKAMKLDGLEAYISVDRSQDMTLGVNDDRSIVLWWKADLIDEQSQTLLSMHGPWDGQRGLSVGLLQGKYYRLHLQFYCHADFPVRLRAGEWNQLAVVKRGTDWRLYHNGELLTRPVLGRWPFQQDANADVPLWIGRDYVNDNPFAGSIDEVMFFDRALSESEVKQIYSLKGAMAPTE